MSTTSKRKFVTPVTGLRELVGADPYQAWWVKVLEKGANATHTPIGIGNVKNEHNARNRTHAKSIIRKLEEALEQGEFFASTDDTVGIVRARFFQNLEDRTLLRKDDTNYLKRSSLNLYRGDWRTRITPTFPDDMLVRDITPAKLNDWLTGHIHLAPATRKRLVSLLRRMLAQAVREKVIPKSPFAEAEETKIPRAKKKRRNLEAPEPDALYPFIAEIAEEHRMVGTFLVFNGGRVSEAIEARWKDCDEDLTYFLPTRQNYRGEITDVKADEQDGERIVPILPFFQAELELHRAKERELGRGGPEDLICHSAAGVALRGDVIRKSIVAAGEAAGLGHVTTHFLRHWFQTHLEEAGVRDAVVRRIIGHAPSRDAHGGYQGRLSRAKTVELVLKRCEEYGLGQVQSPVEDDAVTTL